MARKRQFPPSVDPGLPHEPPCPPGWERKAFGDLLLVVERPVELLDDVEYQLVNAQRNRGGIVPREKLTGREILVKTQFEVKAGDFLISRRQIVHGACGVVPPSLDGALVSNEYAVLRPNNRLLVDYLDNLSYTPYFQRTCFHSSVGVDIEKMVFRLETWLKFHLPIPPVSQQRTIATVLSSVGESIERTETTIAQLRLLRAAAMQELLTRGMPGQHAIFKKTKIGTLPSEWHVKPLGHVCKITSGGTPSRVEPTFWGGTIPWVKTAEVNFSEITSTSEYITEQGLAMSSAKILPAGTVVLAIYGQGNTRGRVGILGIDAATNQACLGFLNPQGVHNIFLYNVLEWNYERLREMGHEGSQKNLSASLVSSFLIPVPTLEEQLAISSVFGSIAATQRAEVTNLEVLRELKQSLNPALLSGEIRVNPDSTTP